MYRHTQKGPWSWLLFATALLVLAVGLLVTDEPGLRVLLGATAAILGLLGASFHQLTVADEGDAVAVRFGPLPLFGKRIPYREIERVEIGRTTFLDGWGIHWSWRGGWVWNIWGRDCVVIRHRGTTRVGTDDAENLASFLKTRIHSGGEWGRSGQIHSGRGGIGRVPGAPAGPAASGWPPGFWRSLPESEPL